MGARTSLSVRQARGGLAREQALFEDDKSSQSAGILAHGLSVVHFDEDHDEQGPADEQENASALRGESTNRDDQRLGETIAQRINSRTSGRIRNLKVVCQSGQIMIQGQCATFYTKQLAQHAAMGVIEDETVVNEIAVGFYR